MEYRQLGRSGFKVPELCFGCGTFGGKNEFFDAWGATSDIAEARKIVDICMDAGLNFFDTADIYSDGGSETVLGGAIKHLKREDVLISTKATFRFGNGANDVGSSRYHLIQALDGSLKRLGTDYVDVYHLHRNRLAHPGRRDALHPRIVRPLAGKVLATSPAPTFGWRLMKSSVRQRALWLDPLHRPPGVLLAAQSRV